MNSKTGIILLTLILTLFVRCMSDKHYTDIHDIHYSANKIIDDPTILLTNPLGEVDIIWYEDPRFDSIQELRSKESEDHYERSITFYKNLFDDPIKQLDYQINEAFAGAILTAPLYFVKSSKGIINSNTSNLIKSGFSISKFKHYSILVSGITIEIIEGSIKMGMKHVIKRHSISYYLKNGLIPTNKTSLFMSSEVSYINSLIKKCNSGNMLLHYKGDKAANVIMEFSIRNKYGIKRNYALVYNKNTNRMVSFFPTSDIPSSSSLFKKTPGNYQVLILKREAKDKYEKELIEKEMKRNELFKLKQIP